MKEIRFTKMHGLGNDYIYVNSDLYDIEDPCAFAVKYSDRRKGIGSDGLILYGKGREEQYQMRVFNADGSEALMCGNAIRCVAKLLYEEGLDKGKQIDIATASGVKHLTLEVNSNGVVERVRVDMNCPRVLARSKVLSIEERAIAGTYVDVGNPHFVHFTSEPVDLFPLEKIGPQVEEHPFFQPGKVNFEVAQVLDEHTIEMRVWERGSGLTMACGTGACAVAVAAIDGQLAKTPIEVRMLGGTLLIEWSGAEESPLFMTGDATKVYEGILYE